MSPDRNFCSPGYSQLKKLIRIFKKNKHAVNFLNTALLLNGLSKFALLITGLLLFGKLV
jgi:hypothetical protein